MFDQFLTYLTQFLGFLDIREPAAAYGAIFGLVGFALQLLVRAEWPTGRLNDGSPKVVDPTAAAWSLLSAVVIGMAAAKYFQLDVTKSAKAAYLAAAPDESRELIEQALDSCSKLPVTPDRPPRDCTPQLQAPAAKAILLIALTYVAADLRIMVDKLQQLFQSIGKLMAAIPRTIRGTR
jgi:hypothetical protein